MIGVNFLKIVIEMMSRIRCSGQELRFLPDGHVLNGTTVAAGCFLAFIHPFDETFHSPPLEFL